MAARNQKSNTICNTWKLKSKFQCPWVKFDDDTAVLVAYTPPWLLGPPLVELGHCSKTHRCDVFIVCPRSRVVTEFLMFPSCPRDTFSSNPFPAVSLMIRIPAAVVDRPLQLMTCGLECSASGSLFHSDEQTGQLICILSSLLLSSLCLHCIWNCVHQTVW